MAAVNGKHRLFCPPGFTGLNGEKYQLVRFNSGYDYHFEGLKNLLIQQADEHGLSFGDEMMGPLTEALMKGNQCSAVLCIRQNGDNIANDDVVGLVSYTKEISINGPIYFIEDIVVDAKHRRQRIGSKIISSLITHAGKNKKTGIRLYSKVNNIPGMKLFNIFGPVLSRELPSVMEVPIPKDAVSLSKNIVELEPKHIHDVCSLLDRELRVRPKWSLVGPLFSMAANQVDGMSGLVSIKNERVIGAAILCAGYGTLSATTFTHVPIIAGSNIPDLICGIKYMHKRLGRIGCATIDFRDNPPEYWMSLRELAEHAGACELVRANERMIPGALGGSAFSDGAQKIARRILDMTHMSIEAPKTPRGHVSSVLSREQQQAVPQ